MPFKFLRLDTDTGRQTWSDGTTGGGGGGTITSVFGRSTPAIVAQVGDYASFYQPLSTRLTQFSGLSPTAGQLLKGDGFGAWIPSSLNSADIPFLDASKINSGFLPISRGGTGAGTAADALFLLGALPSAGGTMFGQLTLSAGSIFNPIVPLVITSNPLAPTLVFGGVEFDGSDLYLSVNPGSPVRRKLAFTDSPTFTGAPVVPTAPPGTSTTQIASTAFVNAAVSSGGTYNPSAVVITGGTIDGAAIGSNVRSTGAFTALSLTTPLAVTAGGTGGNTSATARTGLGLGIGTDVLAFSSSLSGIAGLAPTTGQFLKFGASAWGASSLAASDLPAHSAALITSGTLGIGIIPTGVTASTVCLGSDPRLSDARPPLAHNQAWSTITATPTTVSGYGITDAVVAATSFTGNPALASPASTGTITQLFSWIMGRIAAISGTANWFDAPATSLAVAATHIASTSNPHGTTAAQVGNTTAQWNASQLQGIAVPVPSGSNTVPTFNAGAITWATASSGITLTSLSATAPLAYNNTTGVFSIPAASSSSNGFLNSTDWTAFNNKQSALGFTPVNQAGDTLTGSLVTAVGTATLAAARIPAGAILTTPISGVIENNGTNLFYTNNAATRQTLAFLNSTITGSAANITGIAAVANGGTGAATAVAGLTALGGAALAGATFTGAVVLPIGTATLAALRMPVGAVLTTPVSGVFENNGTNVFYTNAALARKTLAFLDSSITGNAANITGIAAIANGGTGAATASAALTALGGISVTGVNDRLLLYIPTTVQSTSVPATTETAVVFGSPTKNIGSLWASNAFTPSVSGIYAIIFDGILSAPGAGSFFYVAIYAGATALVYPFSGSWASVGGNPSIGFVKPLPMVAGTAYSFRVFCSNATTIASSGVSIEFKST